MRISKKNFSFYDPKCYFSQFFLCEHYLMGISCIALWISSVLIVFHSFLIWRTSSGLKSFGTYSICNSCKLTKSIFGVMYGLQVCAKYHSILWVVQLIFCQALPNCYLSLICFSLMTSHTKTFLGNLSFLITLTLSCARCSTHS
jgi:hypothetical protein